MSGLVLWSSLLSLAWSEQVYYSPLSTQCPDASHSAAFLSHNDIFLFDHDVTGEFPDIKRSGGPSSAQGAFEHNEKFPNFPDKESRIFGFQNVRSELVNILDDLYKARLKKTKSLSLRGQNEQLFVFSELSGRDAMHKRSIDAMKPTVTASEKSRAQNGLDGMVDNTKENWPEKGNNVSSTFPSERHQKLSKYEKSERKRRNTQFAYKFHDSMSQKLQQTQLRSSVNQHHPTNDPKPSTTSIPEVLESSLSNRNSDSKLHQNLKANGHIKRLVSKQKKLQSVDSSYHLQPQLSERNTIFPPMERLPSSRSGFPKMQQNSGKKLTPKSLHREKHSVRSIKSQTAAWLNDLKKVNPNLWNILHQMNSRHNSSENLRRNNTDHMVNVLLYCLGTDPSDLNEMSYNRSEQETRSTVHQVSKQKRTTLERNISRPERTNEENKLPIDLHSTKRSEMYGSHVLSTVSKLAESAKAYRSSMLGNLLQQQPKLIKRLSFVHPRCLTGKLDFVKSTANIDADILQFLTELTDTVSPANFSEVNPTSTQNRHGQATHLQQEPQSGLVQPQKRAQLNGLLASLPTKQNRTLRSIGKRNGAAQRFSPGSRLPWTCTSNTRWRDLGMHVFPRYVQETSCGGDNNDNNDDINDNTPTCWYGFYHCRPTTSAVQVLVRHTGTCNDSRVPQNMRRHYFLSIISINTGCHCV